MNFLKLSSNKKFKNSFFISLFLGNLILFTTVSSLARTNINLIISVDWEGYSLEEHNLESFRKFRQDYPEIKVIHFLNAAYFLKPGFKIFKDFQNNKIRKKIESVIRPGDELGIHIHATETLLQKANVEFRESETFSGVEKSIPIDGIRGHDVPLTLFTEEELLKLIKTSIQVLNENGFTHLNSFRAGGWAASPQVLSALVKAGIHIDSSAVSPEIVRGITGTEMPLYKNVVHKLWNKINFSTNQPFLIETHHGLINEIPNNFGLADYITADQVFEELQKIIQSPGHEPIASINLHYGFHQETATRYIDRVRTLVDYLKQYANENIDIKLESKTFLQFKLNTPSSLYCRNLFNRKK